MSTATASKPTATYAVWDVLWSLYNERHVFSHFLSDKERAEQLNDQLLPVFRALPEGAIVSLSPSILATLRGFRVEFIKPIQAATLSLAEELQEVDTETA